MSEPLPLESYYELTLLTDVALSPDGDRAAFVATEFDEDDDESHTSLFTVPTDGSQAPYRLTRASDANAPKWSPDGSKLGFVAAREEDVELSVGRTGEEAEDEDGAGDDTGAETGDEDESADEETGTGGEGPKPQLWVFDVERGGDARQVTDRDEGVESFDWAPDGDRVVIASRDPSDDEAEYLRERRDEDGPIEIDRLQHKFDGQGWLDDVTTYLFVVDVDTREERRLDDAYARGAGAVTSGPSPVWSPDGDRIAFRSYRGDDPDDTYVQDVYTITPEGDDLTRVTDGDLSTDRLAWSDDGSKLAFAGRRPDNWYVPTELYVADVDDGDGTYRSVSASLDRTLAWGGPPQWIDDDTLVALVGDEGRTRICRFDAERDDPERVFDRQAEDEAILTIDVEAGTVAAIVTGPESGRDLHAMAVDDVDADRGGDDPRDRLTATNHDLMETYEQPAVHRFTFESDDGTEIEALAYASPDFDVEDPDPRPLVLQIHGGPMTYDQPEWAFTDAVYTTRDYVVLKVNYRGSTSYGREFCERLRGKWNTVEVEDLLAGVRAAVDRDWADPDRLFCTGFSQGGINTAYAITRDDPFAAAAAEHGIYDARSGFGTDDSHNWWEADFGLPWENPEAYDAASSITDAGEIDTPLLLTAGEEDWRCPPTQAEQLYVSVKKQGVPAKLVVYPGEHHDVGDPDRAIHRLEELTAWFAEHDPERETGAGEDSTEVAGDA
jgi:dipeptidyl aminopeptidase/acylaminoacyl peptidase